MRAKRRPVTTRSAARLLLLFCVVAGAACISRYVVAQDAGALRARHEALREQLAQSPFRRPLHLESSETASQLKGDIYARIDQPFGSAAPALQASKHWCDILILHLNVKHCEASVDGAAEKVAVIIGRKYDQPLSDGYRVEFTYKAAAGADYVGVELRAPSGPMGTKDYRIVLEAAPLDGRGTFLHLSYSYGFGMAARIALQGYLATLGRDKVGFSLERRADGSATHVGGVRGVVERNTMRYYLAVEAYLRSVKLPPSEQVERRLRDWYAATERYPVQLHELERDEYLAMKRKEVKRQQAGLDAAPK